MSDEKFREKEFYRKKAILMIEKTSDVMLLIAIYSFINNMVDKLEKE